MFKHTFPRGGLHIPHFKELTQGKAIEVMPVPHKVVLPVQQHIGAPARILVEVGTVVKAGELIAESGGFVSAPVHASIAGKVTAISEIQTSSHQLCQAVVIEAVGEQVNNFTEERDWRVLEKRELLDSIRDAGIVGMGGAGFPTHVKLTPPEGKKIDTVLINAAECEPYLTVDHRLMLERTMDLLTGVRIILKAVGAEKAYIAIEDNKPEAISHLTAALGADSTVQVAVLQTKYPQGSEKHLIKAVLNREVPLGGLPLEVGVVVQNVHTAVAIADAVVRKKPLYERVVTVSGKGIANPKNVLVPLGTPLADLIAYCGGVVDAQARIIVGGPMTGLAQDALTPPIVKNTSGILVLASDEYVDREMGNCIRCAKCVDACPMYLIPNQVGLFAKKRMWEKALEYHITDCIECGACAYTCPAARPLVYWIKEGKRAIALKKIHNTS